MHRFVFVTKHALHGSILVYAPHIFLHVIVDVARRNRPTVKSYKPEYSNWKKQLKPWRRNLSRLRSKHCTADSFIFARLSLEEFLAFPSIIIRKIKAIIMCCDKISEITFAKLNDKSECTVFFKFTNLSCKYQGIYC